MLSPFDSLKNPAVLVNKSHRHDALLGCRLKVLGAMVGTIALLALAGAEVPVESDFGDDLLLLVCVGSHCQPLRHGDSPSILSRQKQR